MNERKQIWSSGPIAQWNAEVTIAAVGTNFGRQTSLPHDTLFDITARWLGPPAPGFPPSGRPVSASSSVLVTSHEAALRVANAAVDVLRRAKIPDLRMLAGEHSVASPGQPSSAP
jgi:hypothetical protein